MMKKIQDLIEDDFDITLSKFGSTFFCSFNKQIAANEFIKDEAENKNNIEEAINIIWNKYYNK